MMENFPEAEAINNFKVADYNDELHAEVLDDLKVGEYGYKYRIIDGVVMPPYITLKRYHLSRSIKSRAKDVCYTSFPKSGSTWLSYILLLLTSNGEQPIDKTLRNHLHWVASSWTYPRSKQELNALPSPRIFKSHMPFHMAVGGNPIEQPCKYIYIARNPKDVAVSYYYFERHQKWSGNYQGSWGHWLNMFIEGQVQRGSWFDHVLSWWNQRNAANIMFIKYENLKKNFDSELKNMAHFLGYTLTPEAIENIKKKTSFEYMKQDKFSNMNEIGGFEGFFRKGEIGSWKDQFTVAQNEQFDEMYAERMEASGLDFDFE